MSDLRDSSQSEHGPAGPILKPFEAHRYYRADSLVEAARDYAQAGAPAKALTLLEETANHGWPGLERLKIDPDFDPLRTDPRFATLMKWAGFE